LLSVVNDVLDVTRLETGAVTLDKEPVGLAQLADNIAQNTEGESPRAVGS